MNLAEGKIYSTYAIESLDLPLNVEKRLESLGMISGTKIDVLNNKSNGTVIVKVRGTRFAIGKGITRNILIRG